MTNPTALRDAIADELAINPAGLTITNLGRRLESSNLPELSRLLLELQDQRLIRHTGGRWRWIGPPRNYRRNTLTAKSRPTGAASEGTSHVAVTQAALPSIGAALSGSSRWDVFRRLCRYYGEFVRLEERASVRVNANREQQDFVQIPGAVDWASLEAGRSVTVILPPESGVFVRRGLSGNKLPYWFLGLPVDVFHGKDKEGGEDWISLEPIIVAAVRPEIRDERTIVLEPLAPLEVNPGWLNRRFKRADQRLEFLATVGLDDSSVGAMDEGEETCLRLTSFRTAVDALRIAYKGWWREYPSLDGLQTEPSLTMLRDNGLYNRAVLVSQPRLKYAKRLFDELMQLADPGRVTDEELDRTALVALFPHEPAKHPPEREIAAAAAAEYQLLNDEQRQAVEAAQRHRLTVLTGPPGTGKSVTVAHVMCNMAMEGRSVLFASRNHQAIEAVEPKLNALVEPETLVMRPSRPWGQEAKIADWQQGLIQLLTRPRQPGAVEALQIARAQIEETLATRSRIETDMRRLLDLGDALAKLEQQVQESMKSVAPPMQPLVTSEAGLPAIEDFDALLCQLLASATPGAWWRRNLRRIQKWTLRLLGRSADRALLARVSELSERIESFTHGQMRVLASEQLAVLADELQRLRPFVDACAACHSLAVFRIEIESVPPRDELDKQLELATETLQTHTVSMLRLLAEVSGAEIDPETRQRFAELRAGLENHRGSASQQRFERAFTASLPDLLKHYPLWAVSNLSAYKSMPLAPGVADLLIIDEASQCDIPSVVPLLFRARRALIVGDPMQLGHITTMSRPAELRVRQTHGLVGPQELERFSVGSNSMYDLAASAASRDVMIQLRAHYRCHPHIADYCNRSFYNGTLRIMTNTGRLKHLPGLAETARACEWTDVRGEILAASSGCYSPAEVDAALQQLEKLDTSGFEGTVGVVTPFRTQANRIHDAVTARFSGHKLDRMKFLAHTVDGFQGDERDVILFSLVGGPGMPQGSYGFLASAPNRFNVAISRGRAFVRIIGNRQWAETCGIPHISGLVKACSAQDETYNPRPQLIGPVWEPRLAEAMRTRGMEFRQQYATCGYYLDFALVSDRFRLDVEVDGETWHRGSDGKRLVDDLYRDYALKAAGWYVLRFWVYQLREDIDGCIDTIQSIWERGSGEH